MKRSLLYLLFSGLIFTACNQSATTEQAAKPEINPEAVKTVEFHVTGMGCGGCENKIMTAVNQLDGVSESFASHADELTVVSYDTTLTNPEIIRAAIEKTGYPAELMAMKPVNEE